jgi:hypothetical protein
MREIALADGPGDQRPPRQGGAGAAGPVRGGRYLDDRSFDPFWERAQDLDVPVYLHAADAAALPASQAGRPELRGPTWCWTAETATHALRIVFGGVFDRFPRVRVILGAPPTVVTRAQPAASTRSDHVHIHHRTHQ